MSTEIVPFDFHGDRLEVVRDEAGEVMVGVRAVCEGLGVAYQTQMRKLADDSAATVTMMVTVAADGKNREMACVPLRALPIWLATINPNKVAPHIREKLIRYRQDAADVLADHFLGARGNKAQATAEPSLAQAVTALLTGVQAMMAMAARNEQTMAAVVARLLPPAPPALPPAHQAPPVSVEWLSPTWLGEHLARDLGWKPSAQMVNEAARERGCQRAGLWRKEPVWIERLGTHKLCDKYNPSILPTLLAHFQGQRPPAPLSRGEWSRGAQGVLKAILDQH